MSTQIYVSNSEELVLALANASGGETIVLNPGDYGRFYLKGVEFSETVTITSATEDLAVFGKIELRNVSNLSFDSVEVNFVRNDTEASYVNAIQVYSSSNISVSNSDIHSVVDDTFDNDGELFHARDSSGITLHNNDFHDAVTAASFSRALDVTITDNVFHDIRSDGVKFAQASDVVIKGNHFSDFYPAAYDHSDAIQFYTSGTQESSKNIVIQDNVIMQGDGLFFQSIFVTSADEHLPYHNVNISNNLIYNGSAHGITVSNTIDLTVDQNTVLTYPGSSMEPAIIVSSSSGEVIVTNNLANDILDNGNVITAYSSNVLVQNDDPHADNYYGDIFVDPFAGAKASAESFVLKQPVENLVSQTADSTVEEVTPVAAEEEVTPVTAEANEPIVTGGDEINALALDMEYVDLTEGPVNLGRPEGLFNTEDFYLSFDFLAHDESRQALYWSHSSITIELYNGNIEATVDTDTGESILLKITDPDVFDGNFHSLALSYDQATGQLQLILDDKISTVATDVTGSIEAPSSWDVIVGGYPWGRELNGEIRNLEFWRESEPQTDVEEVVSVSNTSTEADNVVLEDLALEEQEATEAASQTIDFSNVETTLDTLDESAFVGSARHEDDTLVFDGNGYVKIGASDANKTFEDFTVSLDLQSEYLENGGRLLWAQGRFGIQVRGDDLIVKVFTSDGRFNLRVKDGAETLSDGNWHRLGVTYDSEQGVLTTYIDGDVWGSRSGISGDIGIQKDWPITIGGTTRGREIEGKIENVTLLSVSNEDILQVSKNGQKQDSSVDIYNLSEEYDPDDYWDTPSSTEDVIVHI